MTLLEEIQAKCTVEELASQDTFLIAAKVSLGRTKPAKTRIGEGTILDVLGVPVGNSFLDVINSVADYRYVKNIILRGEFDLSLASSQTGVQALVPSVLTQEQADALKALGKAPDPVQELAVRRVCWSDTGEWLA